MESELTLVLGNRNFSSWSLRAWLALRWAGATFDEVQVFFDEDGDRARRREHGPTGRVPVLRVGSFAIWDSLAIAEYVAERFPRAGLWPSEPEARARARSLVCEMHSGFDALRRELPLDCRAQKPARDRGADVAADIARILEAWTETRARFGAGGAFLFGARSLADAFYAPVASRFVTYSVPLAGPAESYARTLLEEPDVRAWLQAAEVEGHDVAEFSRHE